MRYLFLPAALFLLLPACQKPEDNSMSHDETPTAEDGSHSVAFTTLVQGNQSAITELRVTSIRSSEAWQHFWSAHTGQSLDPAPAPTVDFQQDMLIVVMLGQRPNPGYGLVVEDLFQEDDGLVVMARESQPDPERMYAQVVCTPFQMIVTRAFDGPLDFRLR